MLSSLGISNDDLRTRKIDILNSKGDTFVDPETGTVDKLGAKFWDPAHVAEDFADLVWGQDDRNIFSSLDPFKPIKPTGVYLQNFSV